MAEFDFQVRGKAFLLKKAFTTGREEIFCDGIKLAEGGGVAGQFKGKRTHSFVYDGNSYIITISDALGPMNMKVSVNGREEKVTVTQRVGKQHLITVAVVIPLLGVGYAFYQFSMAASPKSGWAIGGLVGMLIGVVVFEAGVLYGIMRKKKQGS